MLRATASCSVTPAQAGVQRAGRGPTAWIPACAGMTTRGYGSPLDSRLRGNDSRKVNKHQTRHKDA